MAETRDARVSYRTTTKRKHSLEERARKANVSVSELLDTITDTNRRRRYRNKDRAIMQSIVKSTSYLNAFHEFVDTYRDQLPDSLMDEMDRVLGNMDEGEQEIWAACSL